MPGRIRLPKSICLIYAVHDKDSPFYLSKFFCIGKREEKMSDMSITISIVALRDSFLHKDVKKSMDWIASLRLCRSLWQRHLKLKAVHVFSTSLARGCTNLP